MTIHLLSGIPGSGKTTWINSLNPKYVLHRDEVRAELRKQMNSQEYFPVSQKQEYEYWISACADMVNSHPDAADIYFDQTTISTSAAVKFINALNKRINVENYCIVIENFICPLEVALRRNAKREGFERVPDKVLKQMFRAHNLNLFDILDNIKSHHHSILVSIQKRDENGKILRNLK